VLEKGQLAVITGLLSDQIGFGLEAAVAADVFDFHPMVAQNAPYEQAAVAPGRALFTTQDGDPKFAQSLLQARESFLEKLRACHAIIEHMSFAIVEFGASGSSAEFSAHMEIADALGD
jgi:hypothetical protein